MWLPISPIKDNTECGPRTRTTEWDPGTARRLGDPGTAKTCRPHALMRGRSGAWSAQRFKGGSAGRELRDRTLGPNRQPGGACYRFGSHLRFYLKEPYC